MTELLVGDDDGERGDGHSHHKQGNKEDDEHAVDHVRAPDAVHDVLKLVEDGSINEWAVKTDDCNTRQVPGHVWDRSLDLADLRVQT